jgi:hypothetical protein
MPKKPPASMGPRPNRPSPEDLARRSVARLEQAPGDRVRLVFRATISRAAAEAISATAITREINLVTVVEEILESAAAKLKTRSA